MANIDIEYGAARRSDSINRKFVGIMQPGPYKGFNVAWSGTGPQVKISNLDEPGEENILLTPQGVRIREAAGWEQLVTGPTTLGSYVLVCRYDHAVVGSDPSYSIILSSAVVEATDTILAAFYHAGLADYSVVGFVEGSRFRDGGKKHPISAIDGAGKDAVIGEVLLQGVDWLNTLGHGSEDAMYFYGITPRDFDDAHPIGCYARVFFGTDTDGIPGDIRLGCFVNGEGWPQTRGQAAVSTSVTKHTYTLPDNGVPNSRWWVDVPFPMDAWIPGRPFELILVRYGNDAEDTFTPSLGQILVALVYPKSKIGGSIDDLQIVSE